VLKQEVQTRKVSLEAKLQWKEKLSGADEEWLDGEGNVVGEEHVINALETASN